MAYLVKKPKSDLMGFTVPAKYAGARHSTYWADGTMTYEGQVGVGSSPEPLPMTPALAAEVLLHMPRIAQYDSPRSLSGTDPEIFALDGKGDVLPAWQYLGAKPSVVPTEGACYIDGVQAEIGFGGGHACHQYMTRDVQHNLVKLLAKAKLVDSEATLLAKDVVDVRPEMLASGPQEHVMFGCAPSQNAYDIAPIAIAEPATHPLRYSGCHLHFSSQMAVPQHGPNGVISTMDRIAGLLLTAIGRGLEDPRRRVAYGRPGEYRFAMKDSGHANKTTYPDTWRLEYRTPGSMLLRHPSIFILAADICRLAFNIGYTVPGHLLPISDSAVDIIMRCDADAACTEIQRHEKFFTEFLYRLNPDKGAAILQRLVYKGAQSVGWGKQGIYDSWHLGAPITNHGFADVRCSSI